MIFNGKEPSEISPSEIRSLLGCRESIGLDFKQLAYSKCKKKGNERALSLLSLLKDVASFANANGGYIIIGVIEEPKYTANKFINIEGAEKEIQKMYDICMEHINPKLTENELIIDIYSVEKEKEIIITRILPGSRKPYMVTYNNNTLFYIRRDNGRQGYNDQMTYDEIKKTFLQDLVLRKLDEVVHKVNGITNILQKGEDSGK